MQIKVTSRHMDVSNALEQRAQNAVTDMLEKYFGHGLGADVVFSKGAGGFHCMITVHVHRNLELQASHEQGDAHDCTAGARLVPKPARGADLRIEETWLPTAPGVA